MCQPHADTTPTNCVRAHSDTKHGDGADDADNDVYAEAISAPGSNIVSLTFCRIANDLVNMVNCPHNIYVCYVRCNGLVYRLGIRRQHSPTDMTRSIYGIVMKDDDDYDVYVDTDIN